MPQTDHAAPKRAQDTAMFREAGETPARIAEQFAKNAALMTRLGAELRGANPCVVVTCARGSSDHAATYAKYLIETKLGLVTASAAPSIASVYEAKPKLGQAVFIAISQSGRSPDLVASTENARRAGARVIAMVNHVDSPLAALAHDVVPLHVGPEKSVAATKSCIGAFAAIAHLVAEWADSETMRSELKGFPEQLEKAWCKDWSAALPALVPANDMVVVGRGLGFGAAQEAALKLKETCALHAEAISAAELRHGPMALVKPGFPVLIFSQNDRTRAGVVELTKILTAQNAQLLVAGFEQSQVCNLAVVDGVPAFEPMTMLLSFYRLANALALARGFDPDSPPNLKKITETI